MQRGKVASSSLVGPAIPVFDGKSKIPNLKFKHRDLAFPEDLIQARPVPFSVVVVSKAVIVVVIVIEFVEVK